MATEGADVGYCNSITQFVVYIRRHMEWQYDKIIQYYYMHTEECEVTLSLQSVKHVQQ
jgi:hypothetical protein